MNSTYTAISLRIQKFSDDNWCMIRFENHSNQDIEIWSFPTEPKLKPIFMGIISSNRLLVWEGEAADINLETLLFKPNIEELIPCHQNECGAPDVEKE